MTNHYQRGRRVEQQVIDHLGGLGYDCIRAAASKGAGDIWAIHDQELCLIQVKINDKSLPSPAERTELLRIARRVTGAYALVAFKVPDESDKRKSRIVFRQLTGTGPREFVPWIPQGVTYSTEDVSV